MDAEVFQSLKNLTASVASLSELFQRDPSRSQWLTVDACGIHADFSRQRIDLSLFEALCHSAEIMDIRGSFGKMTAGEIMNVTEGRSVGHMALRAPANSSALAQLTTTAVGPNTSRLALSPAFKKSFAEIV